MNRQGSRTKRRMGMISARPHTDAASRTGNSSRLAEASHEDMLLCCVLACCSKLSQVLVAVIIMLLAQDALIR